jgi:predicted O-methyltransferase YrrM
MKKLRLGSKRGAAFAAVAVLTITIAGTALSGRTAPAVALLGLLAGGIGLLVVQGLWQLRQQLNRIGEQNARTAKRVGAAVTAVERADRNVQRVLAGADKDRAMATARHKRVDTVLGSLRHQVNHDAINLQRAQQRELEGLHQLFGDFTPRAPMPSSGQWALNPTDLLALLHLVERRRPAVVVELGSGTSTIWIAYALERLGGRLISLDHERTYADRTRAMLHAHGLEAVAEVRDAPLRRITVQGTEFDWYDTDALDDVDGIDLLLVDGPPGSVGPMSRYPALEVLRGKLSPGATVVLDDISRDDEQETLRRWAAEHPGAGIEPTLIGQHGVLSFARPTAPGQRPGPLEPAATVG